jgi:hypothetical protein
MGRFRGLIILTLSFCISFAAISFIHVEAGGKTPVPKWEVRLLDEGSESAIYGPAAYVFRNGVEGVTTSAEKGNCSGCTYSDLSVEISTPIAGPPGNAWFGYRGFMNSTLANGVLPKGIYPMFGLDGPMIPGSTQECQDADCVTSFLEGHRFPQYEYRTARLSFRLFEVDMFRDIPVSDVPYKAIGNPAISVLGPDCNHDPKYSTIGLSWGGQTIWVLHPDSVTWQITVLASPVGIVEVNPIRTYSKRSGEGCGIEISGKIVTQPLSYSIEWKQVK